MYQIIAPSGKGKSTLVGLLAGTRGDFLGKIYFEGQLTTGLSPYAWSQWRALQCSVLFQDLQLFPSLTAMENIQLTAEIRLVKCSGLQF
jgi:ABC-type lipoprotein export system ATPase subunit